MMVEIVAALFYLAIIAMPIWIGAERLGLLIARKLFPSLPAKFKWRRFESFFITCGIIVGLMALVFSLWPELSCILRLPQWAPFYGVLVDEPVLLGTFIVFLAIVMSEVVVACRYSLLRRLRKTRE